jgi:choice-of-anchor C domain-containing protein
MSAILEKEKKSGVEPPHSKAPAAARACARLESRTAVGHTPGIAPLMPGVRMPPRRPADDDDDRPERRPRGRKKRKSTRNRGLLFAILGGAVILLAVGAVVLILTMSKSPADRDTGGGKGGAAGSGGGADAKGTAAGRSEPNLLVNGSFEDGPEPDAAGPGFTPYEAGSTAIPGWSITRGSVDYIGPYWQHADGRRSIDLNGNEPGAIAQTFRTRMGATYRVTFSLAGNNCGDSGGLKTLVVRAAGREQDFSFDATGRTYADMGWIVRSWEFTADGDETTLEFSSTTETPHACGPALDRVSVVEVKK